MLVIDDESAIAGNLEPGIDLVVARHSGFPLCSEECKVRVAVMDNIVPVIEVSQTICEQEKERTTHHSAISSSSRENGIISGDCVSDSAIERRSRKSTFQRRDRRSRRREKTILLIHMTLILTVKPETPPAWLST